MPFIAQDPSTGANLDTTNLDPDYVIENQSFATTPSMTIPPNVLAIHIAASSAIGTAVVTPTAYDGYGQAMTGNTWSLANNDGGNFAINASTGAITVANASIADGLRFIQVAVTGTPSRGSALSLSKWLFIVVGTGAV